MYIYYRFQNPDVFFFQMNKQPSLENQPPSNSFNQLWQVLCAKPNKMHRTSIAVIINTTFSIITTITAIIFVMSIGIVTMIAAFVTIAATRSNPNSIPTIQMTIS